MLGKGMFVFLGGVVHPSGLFAHGPSPSVLVVRFLCLSRSLLVWPSSPCRLDRLSETDYLGCRLHVRIITPHYIAPRSGVTSDAGPWRRAARPPVAAPAGSREALLARERAAHRDLPRNATEPLRRSARRLSRPPHHLAKDTHLQTLGGPVAQSRAELDRAEQRTRDQ